MTAIDSKIESAKDKFVKICQAARKVDFETAEQVFEVEKFNFLKSIEEGGEYMQSCTQLSMTGVFLEVVSNGLSFDRAARQVYIIPRSVKVGNRYEKRLGYQLTAWLRTARDRL